MYGLGRIRPQRVIRRANFIYEPAIYSSVSFLKRTQRIKNHIALRGILAFTYLGLHDIYHLLRKSNSELLSRLHFHTSEISTFPLMVKSYWFRDRFVCRKRHYAIGLPRSEEH